MRRPTNLSMAAWSSCLLLVNSCAASVRPLVWMTAATSLAPMYSSTNSLADFFTCAVRIDADVLVVEDDHVQTPGERLAVRLRVGRRPAGRRARTRSVLLDRDLDVREHVDLLRLAVFEHLEVVSREARDEVALLVGDDHVDVDVVDLDLEGDRRGRLRVLSLDERAIEEPPRRARAQ